MTTGCFDIWRAATMRQVSLRRLLARCLRRFLHFRLSRSFFSWLDSTLRHVHARRLARTAVLHLARRLCTRALNGWLATVKSLAARERTVRRAVLRGQNRCAAQALDSWCSWAIEQKRLRQSATRVVARLQHRLCARALRSWASQVRGSLRQKISELKEVHNQDTRNIKFLEALVNELFQALESTDPSVPGTTSALAMAVEDGPALGTTTQQYFTQLPESVPPLGPYTSTYRATGSGR